MLREAQDQLAQLEEHRRQMELVLQQEQGDVDRLEGLSLVALYYSLLGTIEERLVTERQEYLVAKINYEESDQAVFQARRSQERLILELASYEFSEREFDCLLEEKRQTLALSGDDKAAAILRLNEQLVDLETDYKELEEAIAAGQDAQRALHEVRWELRAAEQWSSRDRFRRRSFATWKKYARIDKAKWKAEVALHHLRRFQTELADAHDRLDHSLNSIGGFTRFGDLNLSFLTLAWTVDTHIKNASDACDLALKRVEAALTECRQRRADAEVTLRALTEERRRWRIEEA